MQAQRAISDYYILGYYTSTPRKMAAFGKSRSRWNAGPDASLAYREGYYANKVFTQFTEVDKERQLEDALMLGDPSPT